VKKKTFSQIISHSYSACADDMGHLERTEQKISLATGVACFFFASFFCYPSGVHCTAWNFLQM
jgi:hypothetical protein